LKANIKIIFGAVLFLAVLSINTSAEENSPGVLAADPPRSSDFDLELSDQEAETGFTKSLTTDELEASTGTGIKHATSLELELSSGRGFGSDMTLNELEGMVGQGFISRLTPDEIDKISARGTLTDEQARLTTKDLAAITAQGVKFIVDTSKFSPEELAEIKGRGTIQDIGKYPYSIQIGVFRDKANAIAMLETVKGKGYDPYIFRTRDDLGNTLFAVRLGDYETVQEAYAEVTHYKGKEHKEAFVTYINSTQSVKKQDVFEGEKTSPAELSEQLDFDKEYASEDLRTLYSQIQSLQSEVDKLRVESEARKKLKMTETEQQQEEEEILSAAGREYVLSPARTLSFDYLFGYTHNSYDQAEWDAYRLLHTCDHTIVNTLSVNYALFDNLTLGYSVPFIYKYHDLGGEEGSEDVSELGDMSFSLSWQPIKSTGNLPPLICSLSVSAPTGRGPYERNPEVDLSTGSGVYSVAFGFNTHKTIDPVVVFGGLYYSYQFDDTGLDYKVGGRELEEVEPSDGIALSLGIGYALSYAASFNVGVSASYAFGSDYKYKDGETVGTGSSTTASLNFGTGWRFSTQRTISFNVGIGLTNDASDFSFSLRIPFDYEL